jgi:ABC-type uncharacterized transport system involved in gliding motility auxiliary subunit
MQCVPCPFWSSSLALVKFLQTRFMPPKAGCVGSMPVSSTATITPSPEKGEVSAPTALTPTRRCQQRAEHRLPALTGPISFIGMAGVQRPLTEYYMDLPSTLKSAIALLKISVIEPAG